MNVMQSIQILIVEDHQLVREIWTQMLGEEPGFTVVAATGSGEEALSLATTLKQDIMLTDISMTPMSGIELTQRISKSSPAVKVIGLSMHCHTSYVRQMLRAGAKGYVSKNSSREEMVDAIQKVHSGGSYLCREVRDVLAIEELSDKDKEPHLGILSSREMEIVTMVCDGYSSKEMAEKLNISFRTVEVHRHNILKKLKLKNSAALVQFVTSINL
jgi:two-component system, NarL family, invasion response regulator UvrY